MKRAFDDNLPRIKPRVRFRAGPDEGPVTEASAVEAPAVEPAARPLEAEAASGPASIGESASAVHAAVHSAAATVFNESEGPTESELGAATPAGVPRQQAPQARAPKSASPAAPTEGPAAPKPAASAQSARREPAAWPRLEVPSQSNANSAQDHRRRKLRERLWALQNPTPTLDVASPDAPQTVVAAAEGLTQALAEARARADQLEHELSRARADLARAVAEGEAERQRSLLQDSQIGEARALLATLETELSVVEEERDEVLAEVRTLRDADGARRDSLAALSRELDESRRSLAETRAEQAEIVRELEAGDVEIGRLTQEVTRLDGERARLLQELTEMSTARGELADSRRTLERVHQLLAVASVKKR